MTEKSTYQLKLTFPGNLEYVSPVRKFVSEVLLVNNYSQKFAYRSEVIVDEICSNAISYGCQSVDAVVDFRCAIFPDRIEVEVKDQGGCNKDIDRLRVAVRNNEEQKKEFDALDSHIKGCLGLEIVRMLSNQVDLHIDDNNVTTVRVVRNRVSEEEQNPAKLL